MLNVVIFGAPGSGKGRQSELIIKEYGLDHISPKAAYVQAKRVADARGWSEEKVITIVNSHVEKPLLGMFGTEKVNVLKLNVALDKAAENK